MSTKEELSSTLNLLLEPDVDIDFSKLSKEDLERLIKVLSEPSRLIQLGIKHLRNKARKEVLDRPLRDFFEVPLLEGIKSKGNGPLGLGLFPIIIDKSQRLKQKLTKEHQNKEKR